MDELLIVVLFSALTGVMIGSLGTVVTFWLCGALERKTVIEKVSPELRDATIQAEYTQATVGGRQTSDKCTELRLRLLTICTLELLSYVIISIAVVVVIQIGTMRREDLQFAKSAVFHLRLLRLGNVFLFLNKDRRFI